MAARRDEDQSIDDIDLLNIHRYPETVPASIVAQVRNSKIYQKRLEELLKGLPTGRRRQGSDAPAPEQPAPKQPSSGGILDALKKWIP
jgi:hypothetical protein